MSAGAARAEAEFAIIIARVLGLDEVRIRPGYAVDYGAARTTPSFVHQSDVVGND
jgi:hypothetical protein